MNDDDDDFENETVTQPIPVETMAEVAEYWRLYYAELAERSSRPTRDMRPLKRPVETKEAA